MNQTANSQDIQGCILSLLQNISKNAGELTELSSQGNREVLPEITQRVSDIECLVTELKNFLVI